jgi:hypothetical protein
MTARRPIRKGDRIRLIEMPGDPHPIAPGATGTITFVQRDLARDDAWFIGVHWDDGRTLNLIIPPDRFDIITASVRSDVGP